MRVGTTRRAVCARSRPNRTCCAAWAHPRWRAVHARGAGRSEGWSMGWGARGWQGARAIAPAPRAAAACNVPPLARDAARGAAVVGRRASTLTTTSLDHGDLEPSSAL
eukprot:scaffold117511_cov66-Phaeocystis_antarctica.AAC.3